MDREPHYILNALKITNLNDSERAGLEEFAQATGYGTLENLLIQFAQDPRTELLLDEGADKDRIHAAFTAFMDELPFIEPESSTADDDLTAGTGAHIHDILGFDPVTEYMATNEDEEVSETRKLLMMLPDLSLDTYERLEKLAPLVGYQNHHHLLREFVKADGTLEFFRQKPNTQKMDDSLMEFFHWRCFELRLDPHEILRDAGFE